MEKTSILERFRFIMGPGDHGAFFYIALAAPVYFVLFSLLRSYLETVVFGKYPIFCYYRGLHHILWNTTATLALLMTLQAFSKTEVRKLLFLFFGVTFMVVPLLHSWITGDPLHLEYLTGGFKAIARDIATFCWYNPHNRPLAIEMMMLVSGLGFLAFLLTGSKAKGIGTFFASYLMGNMVATHWVGPAHLGKAVFDVNSQWSIQPFQAVFYNYTAAVMIFFAAWKQGLFSPHPNAWKRAFSWGALGWATCAIAVWLMEWFHTPFDIVACGLPVFTAVVMVARMHIPDWSERNSLVVLALLGVLLVFQVWVLGPIYLGIHEHFRSMGAVRWIIEPVSG